MNRARTWFTLALSVTVLSTALVAQKVSITGAGATFPYPIYSKWFSEYNKLHPNVEINYQSIGSGGGVKQLTSQTVVFGASDYPLTPEQQQAAPGKILHFPTVLGAVVPIYNLPGVSAELKFTGPLLADIFLGNITKWNDSRIAKLNEGVSLPNTDITVVHRSDGSGTTYIFVDFLAKLSPEWKKRVGVAGSVNWPVGLGAKGNEAVAGMVKQTPGALGYTEPAYATENKIAFGSVQNAAGKFIKASAASVTAAAAAAVNQMPADFRVSITNPPGDDAYPVASFTWLLLYQDPKDKALAKIMVDFTKWALSEGQKYAADLGYAPLPKGVVDLELKSLATIKTQ
jgi:phosphate transport system substrate-binding protein